MGSILLVLLSCCVFVVPAGAAPTELGQDAWNWNPKWNGWPTRRPPVGPNRARITILDVGSIVSKVHGNGKDFEYIPTIALIEDGTNKIIFDTGLPTDSGSLNRMLKALKDLRIEPAAINKVILSHAHLDHTGHAGIFTEAKIYHGNHVFDGYSLTYIGTYEFGGYNVTENVRIVPTPGHTSTCISALVSNAETLNSIKAQVANTDTLNSDKQHADALKQYLGLVAITGDLFFKVEDLTDSTIWKSSSTDIPKQEESRKAILCDVDYIIPGHGPMFRVPTAQKTGCPNNNNNKCIVVKSGDTFFNLCVVTLQSTMASCIAHSNITNPDLIYPGQQVCA